MKTSHFVASLALGLGVSSAAYADGTFTLPNLPYETDALLPVIDKQTMETHHGKHHRAYVDNLNKAVADNAALAGKSLEEILDVVADYPAAVRNNAGGHWNHTFFWNLMAPVTQSGEPSAELKAAIEKEFGSIEDFQKAFQAAGAGQFGSGWVWLVLTPEGKLVITSTPNQDNPLMGDTKVKGIPVIGNDVWEHAYYLSYQNRRADYLSNWWQVLNWPQASVNYATAVEALK